jgi:hypothetical protein
MLLAPKCVNVQSRAVGWGIVALRIAKEIPHEK